MRDRPRVDVAVVTWNTADLTTGALRRLLDTDQGCDLRLLVRDNASSDGTVEALARQVPEAEVDAGTENLGFARGVNTLLARSEAPWFFLLNPDAWPEPGAIGTLVAAASRRPRAAAVAPLLRNPDGNLQHSTHPFPSVKVALAAALWPRLLGRRRAERMMLVGAWNHDRARPVDWAIGAALLMNREAIDQIGGLDETFFMYVEDLEWCWRAHRRGLEIWFEPSAVVVHVGNVSGAQSYGGARTAAYMGNTYRFYRREHGAVPALLYRAVNIMAAGSRYLGARRTGDRALAEYWRTQVKAHRKPVGGVDRPPAGR